MTKTMLAKVLLPTGLFAMLVIPAGVDSKAHIKANFGKGAVMHELHSMEPRPAPFKPVPKG